MFIVDNDRDTRKTTMVVLTLYPKIWDILISVHSNWPNKSVKSILSVHKNYSFASVEKFQIVSSNDER